MDGSVWNFEGMSRMAHAVSDSILGVIVTIALKEA